MSELAARPPKEACACRGTQLETVRSISVCRVLVLPRAAYEAVAAAFPIGARTVLTNLLSRAQEVPHSASLQLVSV